MSAILLPSALLPTTALVPAGGLLPAGPAGTVPALVAGAVVPAHPAVLAAGPFDGAPARVTVARLVLLTGLALVAGSGLVRPIAGPPVRAERVVAAVAALAVVCAAVAATARSGVSAWGIGLVAVAVVVPVLLGTRYPVAAALPGAAAVALLATVLASARNGIAGTALDAGYAVAAALLAGATLHLLVHRGAAPETPVTGTPVPGTPAPGTAAPGVAVSDTGRDRSAVVGWLAVAAGLLAVATAFAQILLTGPFSVIDLVGTGYGRAALVAALAPAVVTGVLLPGLIAGRRAHRSGAGSPAGSAAGSGRDRARAAALRERTRTVAAAAAVLGVAAAALPAALPVPAAAAEPGRLLARGIDLGSGALTLVVTPMRPGPNLVQLTGPGLVVPDTTGPDPAPVTAAEPMPGHGSGPAGGTGFGVRVADREVPVTARPGAPGGWALVDLPAGTRSLDVLAGGISRTVPVDVGSDRVSPAGATGADGPECASAVLGALVAAGPAAGTVGACPAESLRPADERALRDTVRSLAVRGAPGIALAADASPRSRAAAEAVRAEAAAAGLPLLPQGGADGALLVVSGWQDAARAVREIALAAHDTPTALGGTYLAPWLLTGGVLGAAQSAVVPLPFGPQEPLPQRYVRALAATAPGSAPSTSGLLAWADAGGQRVEEPFGLYGAAPVTVPMSIEPPGETGHHGGPNTAAWFPGGAVVHIGPLAAPTAPATP
ncbi:hypothetical protein C8E95_5776 [Pseudonocardia autotrophica]|uniref:Uncharacterized protein n=3 Tax=Pseudonocardiaceae TaxID=2070 RepID=A0A1Y2MVJ6_PSEAH|nr:hypothetical protein BG845_03483 [Pseudonocardia autotrophica]TDN76565.1 hypothetical protein C8E95_5776 [Pseudonocardia autotrophica]GEC28467.1 hypothetical protein PSA01_54960 [Pseudonocardia saturnea]